MWRKKVIGTLVMPLRERRINECLIFESASFISLLNLFQLQGHPISRKVIEKHSRQLNGSRRMASRHVTLMEPQLSMSLVKVMVQTKN
jgi:hypothetical protein